MKRNRCSLRLPGYDYSSPDAYFFTVCARNRECIFGHVRDGEMYLNEFGIIVRDCWNELPQHFMNVVLDAFQIMPNHVHGIFWIVDQRTDILPTTMARIPSVGMTHASSLQDRIMYAQAVNLPRLPARGPRSGSVGAIIGSFKSAATRLINRSRDRAGVSVWQYNFHERIIRVQSSLERVRRYIENNPVHWSRDRHNPEG
jgi:putative transposase